MSIAITVSFKRYTLNYTRFLLVRLYLNLIFDERNEKRVRALVTQLQSGSGAYDHAYDETMKRIKQQSSFSQDLAKRILGWVTFSARPLTAVELQEAIAVEIGEPSFDETNITDIEDMISVCSGLVIIEEHSNIAKLVHFTAQEYLKRMCYSWFPDVDHLLTDTCLTYLSFDNFDDSSSTQGDTQIQREGYPFYQYSAHEIGTHLSKSFGNVSILLAFLMNDAKISRCMREIFGLSETDCSFTGLHFASLFGLENIMEATPLTECNVNAWDYLNRTPLTWAAGSGNEKIARLLLDRGSDPNSATKEQFTPLFYAAAYGHVEVVRLLIGAGANVNFENKTHETPIFFAAKGTCEVRLGHKLLFGVGDYASVIRLLLDAGANLEHENDYRVTPLFVAAENGNEEAVKLFIERNASTKKCDIASHPLTAAARKGHVKITKLLLESGTDAPGTSVGQDLPMFFRVLSSLSVSDTGDEESSFAALLKESGDASFQDKFKRLPLHWAALRGDSNLVQKMLNAGVNPNPKDIFGRTPLFAAVSMDRVHVVKLLLDHPDIVAQIEDKLGSTPLQEAYRSGTNGATHWKDIANLLKAKMGLHGEHLPNVSTCPFPQQMQAAFSRSCDVCLDSKYIHNSIRECGGCRTRTQKDASPGATAAYCTSCIQRLKNCPVCGQPF